MIVKHRNLLLAVAVLITSIVIFTNTASAVNATFKQKILPINCVFQEVNDGLGTLIYLTPEACGQIIKPPSGSNTSGSSSGNQEQNIPQFDTNRNIFFVPNTTDKNGKPTPITQLPNEPRGGSHNGGIVYSVNSGAVHITILIALFLSLIALSYILYDLTIRRRRS